MIGEEQPPETGPDQRAQRLQNLWLEAQTRAARAYDEWNVGNDLGSIAQSLMAINANLDRLRMTVEELGIFTGGRP